MYLQRKSNEGEANADAAKKLRVDTEAGESKATIDNGFKSTSGETSNGSSVSDTSAQVMVVRIVVNLSLGSPANRLRSQVVCFQI